MPLTRIDLAGRLYPRIENGHAQKLPHEVFELEPVQYTEYISLEISVFFDSMGGLRLRS